MCNICCREFTSWCKAFTKTETLLAILECILLVVLIGFLTFLVLHFITCPNHETSYINYSMAPTHSTQRSTTDQFSRTTTKRITTVSTLTEKNHSQETLDPDIECTWNPSLKTKSPTHYYEFDPSPASRTTTIEIKNKASMPPMMHEYEEWERVEEMDEEELTPNLNMLVLGLVKIKPMRVIFGCTLTIVSEFWALTTASCIEAVRRVDSLDSFVMLQVHGAVRKVADVRVHPRYAARCFNHDIAALRADTPLAGRADAFPRLPTMLDYLLLTVGESLTVLGYGPLRSADGRLEVRGARAVRLTRGACGGALCAGRGPRGRGRGPRGRGPGGRGRGPCARAGAALLAGGTLVGVRAGAPVCGSGPYVNLAALRGWIDSVLRPDRALYV